MLSMILSQNGVGSIHNQITSHLRYLVAIDLNKWIEKMNRYIDVIKLEYCPVDFIEDSFEEVQPCLSVSQSLAYQSTESTLG